MMNVGLCNMALGKWEDAIEAWKKYIIYIKGKIKENGYYYISFIKYFLKDNDSATRNYYIGKIVRLMNENKEFSAKLLPFLKKTEYIKGENEYEFWYRAYNNLIPLLNDKNLSINQNDIRELVIYTVNSNLMSFNINIK